MVIAPFIHAGGCDLTVINEAGALIESRRQAVRGGSEFPATTVINHGEIRSTEGRAIQVRGQGSRVLNYGSLFGGEEVVEARDDFYMENHGLVQIDVTVVDEDGVQFASGEIRNFGTIIATDDGVDLDEGLVYNAATGIIRSVGPDGDRDKAAIDIDGEFDNSRDPVRPANSVTIVNEGLLEGPRGITTAYDPDLPDDDVTQSRQSIEITNSGTIIGRGGIAIGLSPVQCDSTLSLFGDSTIIGDVVFGAGDDLLRIGDMRSSQFSTGILDGGLGFNTVDLSDYSLGNVVAFTRVAPSVFSFSLATTGGTTSGMFANWSEWNFADDVRLSTEALFDTVNLAPIPLPAGLPLLLSAVLGLGIVARRRR